MTTTAIMVRAVWYPGDNQTKGNVDLIFLGVY